MYRMLVVGNFDSKKKNELVIIFFKPSSCCDTFSFQHINYNEWYVPVACILASPTKIIAGWLFLFAVLYSAALLFGMVFVVSFIHGRFHLQPLIMCLDYNVFRPRKWLHQPDRLLQQTQPGHILSLSNSSYSLNHLSLLQFVIPEYAAHAFLVLLFLVSGQWIALLWNLPLLAWNVNKWVTWLIHLHCLCTDIHTSIGLLKKLICTMLLKFSVPCRNTKRRRI